MPLNPANYTSLLGGGSTGSGSGSGGGSYSGTTSWYDSLFSNLGGILIGTGGLVTAIKTDPTEVAKAQNTFYNPFGTGLPATATQKSNTTILIVVLVIAMFAMVMFFALRKK